MFIGTVPYFCVVGEASAIHQVYVEETLNNVVHPVVKQIGLDKAKLGHSLLVRNILNRLRAKGDLLTLQQQFETIFFHKKTRRPVLHIKPDRQFGYVTDYLDIRVSRHPSLRSLFTWESYKKYSHNSFYVFYDNDEVDLPSENIPRLIHEAPGPVYVSTRKRNLSLFEGAAAVIISEKDFKLSISSVSNLVVTLGIDGVSWNNTVIPVEEKKLVGDNYGCRETFFAVFTYAHALTKDMVFSLSLANQAAAEIAGTWGYPSLDEHIPLWQNISKDVNGYTKNGK